MPPTGHGEFVVPVGSELSWDGTFCEYDYEFGNWRAFDDVLGSYASCSLQIGMCSEVGIHVSTDGDND
jgi:hypothetical protein